MRVIDWEFEAGDELVKVCVRDGAPIELRKLLAADLIYDTIGESVGFFRFDAVAARPLAAIVAGYADSGRGYMPHVEAVRDLLHERSQIFEVADVTGSPWIEIDFPNDVVRAAHEVLPQL
jgi:choline kinase